MKYLKIVIILFSIFIFNANSLKVFSGEKSKTELDKIIADIPENWWEGGWDKIVELNQFINNNLDKKQLCAKAQYWIACNYYAKRDYETAIKEYKTLIKLYPDAWAECSKAQFEIGQIYLYRLYKYKDALSAYKTIFKEYPECEFLPEVQRMIAYCYLKMKNFKKAEEEYKKVYSLSGYLDSKLETTKAWWELGEMYFKEALKDDVSKAEKEEKIKKALSYYKKAYFYCPVDNYEVMEWIIDSVVRAFKYLDGNTKRADEFLKFQMNKEEGGKNNLHNPLSEF